MGGRRRIMTPAQRRLADLMIDYWSRFARTGDPNDAPSPGAAPQPWHPGAVQSLAPDHTGPAHTAAHHHCAFWNVRR
ncbi:carboxylesterase family protein [Streptomyces yokosukanensis]